MKRHFAWPITIAAVLHLALLFGFRSPTSRLAPVTSVPPTVELKPMPAFTEPIPVAAADEDGGGHRAALPTQPDELLRPPRPDDSVVSVEPPHPRTDAKITHLPLGPIGPGSGVWSGPANFGGPVPAVALDHPPRTRAQVGPVYPFEARKDGLSGEVLVEFTVDRTGHVQNPRVVRSTHALFNEAALGAVGKWRFEPGRVHGRLVAFRMAVPVIFRIDDN